MSNDPGVTRRQIIVGGIGAAGVAAIGAAAATGGGGGSGPSATSTQPADPTATSANAPRMPVVFLPHGGGPWPWMDMFDKREMAPLSRYLDGLRGLPREKPKALLVVSAHWEERVPTVMTASAPPMLYDYYGFPEDTYTITWPAPGAPALAARVQALLGDAGIPTATNAERGFDHGTFVPLKLTYPDADIPTVQLSLKAGLDPAEHLAIGRALAPLRDEGVFIIGSGMSYHNMRGFRDPSQRTFAETFDAWLKDAATSAPAERDDKLARWAMAPAARQAHPREEHLVPLFVIAGAAGADRGVTGYDGTFAGMRLSAFHYG